MPTSLSKEMLKKIHENHVGIEKCKKRAQDVLYWDDRNSQISDLITHCSTFKQFRKVQQKEPICILGYAIYNRPWQKVSLDLLKFDSENYNVLTDYLSKFFEIIKLQSTKSCTVIKYLKPQFTRYGIPEVVVSNKGLQFYSAEFKEFEKSCKFM